MKDANCWVLAAIKVKGKCEGTCEARRVNLTYLSMKTGIETEYSHDEAVVVAHANLISTPIKREL